MMDDQSFDPRTWNERASPSATSAAAPARAPIEPRATPGEPARAGVIGVSISVAILLAGAAAAYATRPTPDAAAAEAFNSARDAAASSANG